MATMTEHTLEGCRPVPLAGYLKALGILRIVAEQRDGAARGAWRGEVFTLSTALERTELVRFFAEEYRPTPIVAPWNGGSGFYPGDRRTALEPLAASSADRFEPYRRTISAATALLAELGIDQKVDGDQKPTLLEACRGRLPEEALAWLDAAVALTVEQPRFPPLLGTGGNDGRLEFTNNFMQRLVDLFDPATGDPLLATCELLASALFDDPSDSLTSAKIGQFLPGSAGGANAATGFDAKAHVNPWDFVLMLEGAICFAAAVSRKLDAEPASNLSYPFTVTQSAAGYASAAPDDESSARAEMWLPLWGRPTSLGELRILLSEGRARVGRRVATNGVEFARAVATLGTDRGLSSFQRLGFQVRNGLSYFATPLQRMAVGDSPAARLLDQPDLDGWLGRFFWRSKTPQAPGSVGRAGRRLERSIMALCERDEPRRVREVFLELGRCQRALAVSGRWSRDTGLDPMPFLSPKWLEQGGLDLVETRLAAAIASLAFSEPIEGEELEPVPPVRINIEPTEIAKSRVSWREPDRDVVWQTHASVVDNLNAILLRRVARGKLPTVGATLARLDDVSRFVAGDTDDALLGELTAACVLIEPRRMPAVPPAGLTATPHALYSLLKLCFSGSIRGETRILRHAAGGDGVRASRLACRRLRASDLPPAVDEVYCRGQIAARAAAAVLFPLSIKALERLERLVVRDQTEAPSEQRSDS